MTPSYSSEVEAGAAEVWRGKTLYWGRSFGENPNLHDAIAAAVDHAELEGKTFTVVYTEVESVGDPNVGGYSALLSPGS